MLNERSRSKIHSQNTLTNGLMAREQTDTQSNSRFETRQESQSPIKMNVTAEKLDITMGPDANGTTASTNRDDDVTDEVCCQLENDKALAEAQGRKYMQ